MHDRSQSHGLSAEVAPFSVSYYKSTIYNDLSHVHIGKSLSTLPRVDDEGRHPKFREADEQGMPPAKRMCKQATKHGHHKHNQDCHGRHEHRQDCHDHLQPRQNHHSHREDHQDRHSRRENHQDRYSRHEDRQDDHSRREDRQDRQDRRGRHKRQEHHGRHKHHQDRYGRQSREHYDHHLPPTCRKTPHQQPHYHSHYQMPLESASQSFALPSPDSPREKYAIFLRDYYTRHQTTCTKWPSLNIKKFINLAVINNEYANRKDLVKFRKQTIRGCIDDILEWKAPIEMKEILKPNFLYSTQYPVTQLLIEGAPGIGKSTFAWEVCQKWGQHQLFNEYSLVVLLKFRDIRTHKAKSVSDLFYYPLPELQSDIIHDIVLSGGHGLLLILEGFDEAPASKRAMDSIFVRLFRGQELPKATVILTTRPSASAELRQFCSSTNSRRIEIVGFGEKEIDEYIQCAFSDEQSQSDFKEYLSLYPHIHSMMYVPLNSAIVTHVYESCKSSGVVVPKTMTQLYSSLIRTLLLRYLKDKEEYKDTCITINSFKDLPPPVYDQFCEICKIAYTGIMSAEIELIFQDLPIEFDPLGLMQTCPELYVDRGAFVSYNFLHLTVQEYLAAYHISQQSRDEQVAFMRDIKSEKLKVVVRFLAGLTELGRDLWDVVRGFASEDKCNIGAKFLSKENFLRLEILHLLFESQDPSAITSTLGSDCVCFNCDSKLQPFDWYVLGYCITHSSCNWKLEFGSYELESFLRALNLHQDQCQFSPTGRIKEMWLVKHGPAAVHLLVDNMPQLLVFHNLTHLGLGLISCNLTSETCNLLSKHTDLLQHLKYLNLSNNRHIGRGGAVNLITSLTKFSTIRELNLCDTGIGFEDCKALSELLATSKHLKVLDIMFCNIQSSDSVHLAKALEENTTTQLQTLWLDCSPIGSEGAVAFANMLATNKSLTKLNMTSCSIQGEGAVCLAKAMEKNSSVTEFNISCNPIGSEGAVAFADMLATNKSLAELNMGGCTIQGEGAVAFASMLKKNQCLKTLYLSDDSVGVEGTLELIESLKHNTTLEKLWLSKKCKPRSFPTLDKTLRDRITFQ